MLIFVKSNVTLSSWMLWSTLIFGGDGTLYLICHRCEVTDTIEHALIDCSIIDAFWTKVQHLIDKITDSNLPLTVGLKVLAKVPQTSDLLRKKHTDLINWILAIWRSGIHKSAVWHRVHDQTLPPEAIFGSIVKSHLRYQFKLYAQHGTQFYLFFTGA